MNNEEKGAVKWIHGYNQWRNKECRPACIIPFAQKDLKVVIFPDDKTRKQALSEAYPGKYIVKWLFREPGNVPIIATINECLHF
jgi:hypothetical protein